MTLQPLRRVFTVVNGGTPTSEAENWDGDIAWATPIDLGRLNGARISETQRTLTTMGLRTGSSLVPAGSLIVSTRAPIGYVAETTIPMAFNQGCRGLVPRTELDVRFFRYQLAVSAEQLQARGQGSTFVELSTDGLASFPVAVPPLSEQRSIADYLDAETAQIDAVVENRRRQVRLLDARRSSVVVQLATGDADGGADGLISFPVGWAHTRLKFLVQPPQAGDWGDDPTGVDDTFVVRAADFDRKRWRVDPARLPLRSIEKSSFLQRRLRAGDLVLEKSGGGPDQPVGATVSFDLDVSAIASNFAARLRPADGIDGRFLCYALAATYEVGLNQRSVKQTTGIQNLDAGAYLSEAWAVPTYEQQVRIRAQIDAQLTAIDVLQDAAGRQMRLLLERRQALITAAVTGQIAVPGVAA